MSLTIGQVTTARLLLRSVLRNSLDVENQLDELIEKQQGDLKGIQNNFESLMQLIKAASGALVETQPDPVPAPAAQSAPAADPNLL